MVIKKQKGLGLGLAALLGPKVGEVMSSAKNQVLLVGLEKIQGGKWQPRSQIDEEALLELAESIKAHGILQPILVRSVEMKKEGAAEFEIIAGERRWRAARLAGLKEMPVLVKYVVEQSAAAIALIENMQREDLTHLEEARGLQRLIQEFSLSHDEAAKAVGRSRSAASNLLRLLNLPPVVQNMLAAGDLEMGHARALLALPKGEQIVQAQLISAKRLSVREVESLVKKILQNAGEKSLTSKKKMPLEVARMEEDLSDWLTATVEIQIAKNGGGKLSVKFASIEELNGIIEKIKQEALGH